MPRSGKKSPRSFYGLKVGTLRSRRIGLPSNSATAVRDSREARPGYALVWPTLDGYSNQMLRYQRKPEGLVHEVGLPAHRAIPDAYVTAHHLRDLLNEAGLDHLLAWSILPGLLPRVRSGPDRGKAWDRLDMDALSTLARDRDIDVRYSAEAELRRRNLLSEPTGTPFLSQGSLL